MPTPKKPARLSPAERKRARQIRDATNALKASGAAKGIRARLFAGAAEEAIAREISERGDALLKWDHWLNGPIGEPIGDALERWDGPALYEAALALIRAVKAALVRAGKIAA